MHPMSCGRFLFTPCACQSVPGREMPEDRQTPGTLVLVAPGAGKNDNLCSLGTCPGAAPRRDLQVPHPALEGENLLCQLVQRGLPRSLRLAMISGASGAMTTSDASETSMTMPRAAETSETSTTLPIAGETFETSSRAGDTCETSMTLPRTGPCAGSTGSAGPRAGHPRRHVHEHWQRRADPRTGHAKQRRRRWWRHHHGRRMANPDAECGPVGLLEVAGPELGTLCLASQADQN